MPDKQCIYCRIDKDESEFTLEHVIPQSLGGAYAPDNLKTSDVCKACNSNLGLFVDASFEKSWIVSSRLHELAVSVFEPTQSTGLPLVCMGNSELCPPDTPSDCVCESWLGPLGEQVYWIRPVDDRLYWYTGGNPRTTKEIESRAYFLFSDRSPKNPMLSWLAFRDSFGGRRVRKVMCTRVEGASVLDIGFSEPDELDLKRINYFNCQCSTAQMRRSSLSVHTRFDYRFLAKLATGVAYCLFGRKVLDCEYGKELHAALWHRDGQDNPSLRGTTPLSAESDKRLNEIVGHSGAVIIMLLQSSEGISININIGASLNWMVMCAPREILTPVDLATVGEGIVIVLFKTLKLGFSYSLTRYLAHIAGSAPIAELAEIAEKTEKYADYFKSL